MHGGASSGSRLCGCCRPASGHTVRGVSERGPAINEGPHEIHNGRVKEVWTLVILHVSFSCFSGFALVLDLGGRQGGKVGSTCEEFEDNEGGIKGVNVSESSATSKPDFKVTILFNVK